MFVLSSFGHAHLSALMSAPLSLLTLTRNKYLSLVLNVLPLNSLEVICAHIHLSLHILQLTFLNLQPPRLKSNK